MTKRTAPKPTHNQNTRIIRRVPHFKTVLITGGASYLAAKLTNYLLPLGYKVISVDDLSTGCHEYIEPFFGNPRFEFIKANLANEIPTNIQSVDYIFHLLHVKPHLKYTEKNLLESFIEEIEISKNILEFAEKCQAQILIGSTLEVNETDLSNSNLKDYFGKTQEQKAINSFLQSKRFTESLAWEYFREKNLNLRIARLPYYYGQGFLAEKPTHKMAKFIIDANNGKALQISGSGLAKEHYVYISDLVEGLGKALFISNTNGNIYAFADNSGTSELELAYLLKSLFRKNLSIEFIGTDHLDSLEYSTASVSIENNLDWQPTIRLNEGLRITLYDEEKSNQAKTFHKIEKNSETVASNTAYNTIKLTEPQNNVFTLRKVNLLPKIDTEKVRVAKQKFPLVIKKIKLIKSVKVSKRKLARAGLLILPIIFPPLFIGTNIWLGTAYLKQAAKESINLNFDTASQKSQKAIRRFSAAQNFTGKLGLLPAMISGKEKSNELAIYNQTAIYAAETVFYETKGLATLKQSLTAITPQSTTPPPSKEELSLASSNFSKGVERFLLTMGQVKNISKEKIPQPLAKYLIKFEQNEEEVLLNLQSLAIVSQNLPELLGMIEPKHYLILIQNNQELRGGGGFIGSYAVADLEYGKLTNLRVDDVYNLDGLISEENQGLNPPGFISKYLGVDKLYLRDSNYSANFPESANLAKQLYESVEEKEIHGVIAINLSLMTDIFEKIGAIETQEFGQINKNNLAEKSIYYAEKNYFEGAQNKKSFLNTISQLLMEKLIAQPDSILVKIAPAIYDNLKENNISVYLFESNLNDLLAKRGWTQSISNQTASDYLMLVENNVGANKANAKILRSIRYEIREIDRNQNLEATLTISYTNEAENNQWPLGSYQVWGEIANSQENPINFYEEVEPKTTVVKEFTWNLPANINSNNYKLYIQKQPGMENTSFSFFYIPIVGGKEFFYEGYLTKDLQFNIQ